MNKRDIDLCVQAGVQILGFVAEYPEPVPWNLSAAKAGELIRQAPPHIGTCLVTGGPVGKTLRLAKQTCPDFIQLHHKETLAEVRELTGHLKQLGIKTIKALRIDSRGNCDFEITAPLLAARALAKTGIAALLVDTYTASMPGGTGVRVDLATFRTIQKESTVPVILAGGLNPGNILEIIREAQPCAVDLLTGVEESPGRKDPLKINSFMQSIATNC